MKHSNNLTDLVERLQDRDQEQENTPSKAFEVTNETGEVIKLNEGQNNQANKF